VTITTIKLETLSLKNYMVTIIIITSSARISSSRGIYSGQKPDFRDKKQ